MTRSHSGLNPVLRHHDIIIIIISSSSSSSGEVGNVVVEALS
jgi:hypothetical protein